MLIFNKHIANMSEAFIIEEYGKYLQRVSIIVNKMSHQSLSRVDHRCFLSYTEFKDYYILGLMGKHNYTEKLAH